MDDFEFALHLNQFMIEEDRTLYLPNFGGTVTCENLKVTSQLVDNDPLWYFEAIFALNSLVHRLPRYGANEHDSVFSPILKGDQNAKELRAKAECILCWYPVLFPMSHLTAYQNRVIEVIPNLRYIPAKFTDNRRPRPRRSHTSVSHYTL